MIISFSCFDERESILLVKDARLQTKFIMFLLTYIHNYHYLKDKWGDFDIILPLIIVNIMQSKKALDTVNAELPWNYESY